MKTQRTTMTPPPENGKGRTDPDDSHTLLADPDDSLAAQLKAVGFQEDEHLGVPTDRGWGWVIVFCAFLTLCLVMGHNRSLSALFVDITEEFQQPNWVVALTFTVMNITGSVSTVVASNILLKRYTARRISVIASLLNAICTIVVSQSTNIIMWLCVYTVKGVSFGILLALPMTVIGYYFQKRRSLASSLGMLGGAVAFVALPPVAAHIKTLIGLRGTFLLLGGVELHLVATSMLLRPPASYKKIYEKEREAALQKVSKKESCNIIISKPQNGGLGKQGTQPTKSQPAGKEFSPLEKSFVPKIVVEHSQPDSKLGDSTLQVQAHHYLMSTSAPVGNSILDGDWDLNLNPNPHLESEKNNKEPSEPFRHRLISSGSMLNPNPDHHRVSERSLDKLTPWRPVSEKRYSTALTGSLLDVVYVGDVHDLDDDDIDDDSSSDASEMEGDRKGRSDVIRKRGKKKRKALCRMSTFIDTSLFKFWIFRMIMGLAACGAFANFIGVYLPASASSAGIGKQDAALLLTIAGCVDIVVRLAVGFVADMKCVSKEMLVAISLLALGALANCARFYTTYSLFVTYAILSGAFLGFRQTLLNPMLLEYLGPDRTARAFGICTMLINVVMATNHPIVGVLVDITGTFTAALHYVGTFTTIGFLCLLTTPICKRLDKINREREELAKQLKMQLEVVK